MKKNIFIIKNLTISRFSSGRTADNILLCINEGMRNIANFWSKDLNPKIPIKPAQFELQVLALHLIYGSDRVKIRLSIQNYPASKRHCSPSIQGSWLPSPGEIPMGPVSPMEQFALWPIGGSVSTQTKSSRRGSLKKKTLLALQTAADQEVVIISSTLQAEMDLFSVFQCSRQKYIKAHAALVFWSSVISFADGMRLRKATHWCW